MISARFERSVVTVRISVILSQKLVRAVSFSLRQFHGMKSLRIAFSGGAEHWE
jgi:hypothetical protein